MTSLNGDDIIRAYIDNLDKQLKEKDLYAFWTFTDRSGFKKIKISNISNMQEFINQNINKYKNRIICKISITTHNHRIGTIFEKLDAQVMLNMDFFNIDDKGVIKTKGYQQLLKKLCKAIHYSHFAPYFLSK
jgi:hypothetical protein